MGVQKRFALAWTARARKDLLDIGDCIALRSPLVAASFTRELMDAVEVLRNSPNIGRVVPELSREDIRELIHGNYRMVYRVLDTAVHVLTVFEGHRLLDFGVEAYTPGIDLPQ